MTPVSRNPKTQLDNSNELSQKDMLGRVNSIRMHFGKFFWDVLGVFLFVCALLILLGLLGFLRGKLLSVISEDIKFGFGWGSIFLVGALGWGGTLAFRKNRGFLHLRWGRIMSIEIGVFLSLALLAVISNFSLDAIEKGWWGGTIGWGLASFLERGLSTFFDNSSSRIMTGAIFFIGWLLAIMSGFGLWRKTEKWLLHQIGEEPESSGDTVIQKVDAIVSTRDSINAAPLIPQSGKTSVKLPPEFRKTFKVPEKKEEYSKKSPERGDILPPLNLLVSEQNVRPDERNINQVAGLIEKTLADFSIPAKVVGFRIGPSVTQFAVQPGFIKKGIEEDAQQMKVRVAQIASLQKDLALSLSAERLRIEAPVPGRSYVGIEVPNSRSSIVRLRPILELESFYKIASPLAIALGRDVSGQSLVADLVHMPHLLIAGTTGSGKSVCIAAITVCLAMNNSPQELRLVMIDSKMVELIRFNGLPHLLGKVETNIQRILGVLRWVVVEMEHRYKLLEAAHVRDIDAYNRRLQRRKDAQILPRIVVLIDELADLMMSAPDQTEHNLVRLAQMARATGIHLVVATQRPSTDVVTGLIKANFPARLAFSVASGVDSRVILDQPGAETLLGKGDLLFLNPEVGNPIRAQGVMVTDQEIERLIAFWQKTTPQKDVTPPWETLLNESDDGDNDDILVEQAITLLKKERRASASMLQRRLRIGYPRAARLLDQLEEMGTVGPSTGGGRDREVLLEADEEDSDQEEDFISQ